MAKHEIVRRAVAGVQRAKGFCEDIEFSAEDAARTELDFLTEIVEKVIEAGATTVNIPDTVGYAVPEQYAAAIKHLKRTVSGIDKIVLSVHCHNDLGLAVANSLSAIREGARPIECTINGLGERAGNCALEEIVMALRTRSDYFHLSTSINSRQLADQQAGFSRNRIRCKEQGDRGPERLCPQRGFTRTVCSGRTTYESMRPDVVSTTPTVLGKHSGRHALREHLYWAII